MHLAYDYSFTCKLKLKREKRLSDLEPYTLQEWWDTQCQDTVSLATPSTPLHAWNQLEKVGLIAVRILSMFRNYACDISNNRLLQTAHKLWCILYSASIQTPRGLHVGTIGCECI